MLRRHGLSPCRRRRPGAYPALNERLTQPTQPNQVWTIDFKGWFDLSDGQRCDPLTVCDRYTRYVLALRAQPNQPFTAGPKGSGYTFFPIERPKHRSTGRFSNGRLTARASKEERAMAATPAAPEDSIKSASLV